jgi:peptidase E
MRETFYLLSGNINPSFDTDKIHLDMLKQTQKENPMIYLFATASIGTDWHENYVQNISNIFSKYNCQFRIIDNIDDIQNYDFDNVDIIYFLGGSPYKHSFLTKYKTQFDKVSIKAGTSAGAIYLGHETFFAGKDDYIISVPNMLNYVKLHVLPHSETHKEEIVFNYLVNEINIPVLRLYNQSCLKIEKDNNIQYVSVIVGDSKNSDEKVEIILSNNFYKIDEDKYLNLPINILNN